MPRTIAFASLLATLIICLGCNHRASQFTLYNPDHIFPKNEMVYRDSRGNEFLKIANEEPNGPHNTHAESWKDVLVRGAEFHHVPAFLTGDHGIFTEWIESNGDIVRCLLLEEGPQEVAIRAQVVPTTKGWRELASFFKFQGLKMPKISSKHATSSQARHYCAVIGGPRLPMPNTWYDYTEIYGIPLPYLGLLSMPCFDGSVEFTIKKGALYMDITHGSSHEFATEAGKLFKTLRAEESALPKSVTIHQTQAWLSSQ